MVILFFVLTLFTVPISAQQEPSGMGMPAPGIIARPSFETIEGGLELKIWIMGKVSDATVIDSQEIEKNTSDTDEQRNGTHHIMVEVSDALEGNEIADATVSSGVISRWMRRESIS